MNNADLPAAPLSNEDHVMYFVSGDQQAKDFSGLTKREHVSIEMAKAILSNPHMVDSDAASVDKWVTNFAMRMTESLIKEWEK